MNIYFSPEFFINNRYLEWYKSIIQNALIKNQDINEYTEKHHILPSSIFPEFSNLKSHPWNQVRLTFREHFLAHWLLTKCISQKKHTIQMNHALNMMRGGNSNHNRIISSWQYDVAKRAYKRAFDEYWNDPENREKHSVRMIEVLSSPEIKEKQSRSSKEMWSNPETREKILKSMKVMWNNPDVNEKRSKTYKEIWSDPEFKAKRSKAIKEGHNRPEVRAKRQETDSRPEVRAKRTAAQKEAQNRPEVKENRSRVSREIWSRPEIKEKQSSILKERWNNPEWRKENTFYCECCDRTILGKGNWTRHLRSKNH